MSLNHHFLFVSVFFFVANVLFLNRQEVLFCNCQNFTPAMMSCEVNCTEYGPNPSNDTSTEETNIDCLQI